MNRLVTTTDTVAPKFTRLSTGSGRVSAAPSSDIKITFSESIAAGSGNVVLRKSNGDIVETFDVSNSSNLVIRKNTLTIDPTANLEKGTNYVVEFANGAITDRAGNAHTGKSAYNFSTRADRTAPKATRFNPRDGAGGISPATDIVVTFSESVQAGTGSVILKDARGRAVQTFRVNSSMIIGNTLTLNPTSDLALNSKYSVVFTPGAVKDAAGNNYKGTKTYDFRTSPENIPYVPPDNGPISYSDNPQDGSNFNIALSYTGSSSYLTYFQQARSFWENVITGDLPTASGIDDLRITASVTAIDGAGGILGQAGPSSLRSGSNLPVAGTMQFDQADVASMIASGTFLRVVMHEMAHVLGVGSLWSTFGFNSTMGRYTGSHGVAAYQAMSGGNPSATWVPLETGGGAGTQNAHWAESTFNSELMTGYAESTGNMPVSTLTIAALRDLGYTVNTGAAESYTVGQLMAPEGNLLATV